MADRVRQVKELKEARRRVGLLGDDAAALMLPGMPRDSSDGPSKDATRGT